MLSWGTYAIIFVPISILLGYLIWDIYFKTGNKVKVLLFEKVGTSKQFKGSFVAVEKNNKNLGRFLFCKKIGMRMEMPRTEDFFPYPKMNILFVCKYAADDFRIMTILRDNEFYQKTKVEEEEVEVVYEDPIGITQTARESIRFERAFHNEMNDFLKDKPSFWDRYGALMVNGMIIILFMILVIFLVRKNNDLQLQMNQNFAKVAGDYVNEIQSPTFIESMVEQMERERMEQNTPIT